MLYARWLLSKAVLRSFTDSGEFTTKLRGLTGYGSEDDVIYHGLWKLAQTNDDVLKSMYKLFCDAGTIQSYYFSYVHLPTIRWIELATITGHSNVVSNCWTGTTFSNVYSFNNIAFYSYTLCEIAVHHFPMIRKLRCQKCYSVQVLLLICFGLSRHEGK